MAAGGTVAKKGGCSPAALRRWQDVVKKALSSTPELVKRAREEMRKRGDEAERKAVSNRLARATTAASR